MDFLKTLYSEKAESDHIMIWTGQNKRSYFTKSIAEAISYVEENLNDKDVYFGIGTSPEKLGDYNRCPGDKISGIPGFYLDLDYAHPVHKKTDKLPPTIDDAIELATVGDLVPSYVVSSGHGIQVYYLLDDFWHFTCPEERTRAKELNLALHNIVKAKAAEKDWIIDSVFDLARVFRVPDTYNRKDPLDLKLVFVLEDNETTYSLETISTLLDNHARSLPKPTTLETIAKDKSTTFHTDLKELSDTLYLDDRCEPPKHKLDDLKVLFSDFSSDFENKKTPTMKDTTPSAFDMKLAIKAAQMNWSDQEIADLMIAHRNHHGHDLKLKNKQYYARSILSARSFAKRLIEKNRKQEEDHENHEAVEHTEDKKISNYIDTKADIYSSINARLGYKDIKIVEITKYLEDPEPVYYMLVELVMPDTGFLARREICLGNINCVIEHRLFRQKFAAVTNKILKSFDKTEWQSFANCMMAALYERDVAPDSTDIGQINAWLCEYLRPKQPITPEESYDTKDPFVHDGQWHINRDKFFKWAKYHAGSNDTVKSFSLNLKRFGCSPVDIYIADPSNIANRLHIMAWRLPVGFSKS